MQKSICILTIILACFQCTNNSPKLQPFETGELPVYSGEALRNIFYPLGGIGTGNILLGGRGNILELEIFNRAAKDELPPYMTFFSLWYQQEGEKPEAMVLERRFFNDFDNGFGQPRQQLSGLPRFQEVQWSGAPPQIGIDFKDQEVPLAIRLECFNPFIPLDVPSSSMPMGEFTWIISNPGSLPLDFSVAMNISNPFKNLNYRSNKPGHPIRNSSFDNEVSRGLFFENLLDQDHPDFGTMVAASDHQNVRVHTGISSDGWWDDAHMLWGDFSDDGVFKEQDKPLESGGNREVVSSLLVKGHLEAGQVDTIRYYITWHVPNRVLETTQAFGAEEIQAHQTRNFYAKHFADAFDVLENYLTRREGLTETSGQFYKLLTGSTIPGAVLDATASNLASLKSNLLSRLENGDVHGFEGMGADFGCCPGNCTHVWNYAQTLASLFPSLERNVRETAFLGQTFESGYQSFRTSFPAGDFHFKSVAADGQMGNIMRVYREWKFSGDSTWLATIWPAVKRSIKYAWDGPQPGSREWEWARNMKPWDPDKTGVISGRQHNTYDIDFYGPNMLTGGLYLGALKACSEMAHFMGDPGAEEYLGVYESGRHIYDSLLWNGSWYVQQVESGQNRYQFGTGCLSDQLLGQYLAFNSGLGLILDPEKVKSCLLSIHTHNFVGDFSDFQNVQRVYALNDEGGLVLCSWPDGNRDLIPFPYADEVWTGVEYQVAATMIRMGLVSEGLEIVEAVRQRYGGFNRNPYAEIESGFYYARALASWAVLEALSGYGYDGVRHSMIFNPALQGDRYESFWSCGTGWGNYLEQSSEASVQLHYGSLTLKEITLGRWTGRELEAVHIGDKSPGFRWDSSTGTCIFNDPLVLIPHEELTLSITPQ